MVATFLGAGLPADLPISATAGIPFSDPADAVAAGSRGCRLLDRRLAAGWTRGTGSHLDRAFGLDAAAAGRRIGDAIRSDGPRLGGSACRVLRPREPVGNVNTVLFEGACGRWHRDRHRFSDRARVAKWNSEVPACGG